MSRNLPKTFGISEAYLSKAESQLARRRLSKTLIKITNPRNLANPQIMSFLVISCQFISKLARNMQFYEI